MPIKMDMSGLKQLKKNLEALSGTHQVPFLDIFNPKFISANSRFGDFQDFARGAGYEVVTKEDLAAIPDDPWDEFIRRETPFESWSEMQKAAVMEHAKAALHKGIKR